MRRGRKKYYKVAHRKEIDEAMSSFLACGGKVEKSREYGRYYVYLLKDNRDGSIFYVGKGSGNRVVKHMEGIASGFMASRNKDLQDRMQSILSSGGEIEWEIVFRSNNEEVAYEEERRWIHDLGLESLCNKKMGGEGPRRYVWYKKG